MPSIHKSILKTGKKLGYFTKNLGINHGFTLAWLMACMSKDEIKYKQRIQRILNEEDLPEKITQARDKSKLHMDLTPTELETLEILSFYETIFMHHDPSHFDEVFHVETSLNQGDFDKIPQLSYSDSVQAQGGLTTVYSESNIYTKSEINDYLNRVTQAIDRVGYDDDSIIALTLNDHQHIIGLTYYPKQGQWVLMDIEHWPPKTYAKDEMQKMARKIHQSFGGGIFNSDIAFKTQAITTGNNLKKIELQQQLQTINALQVITLDRSKRRKLNHAVYIAAKNGDVAKIAALAALGADLSAPTNGFTPAYIAAEAGHANVIQELAKHQVDFNVPTRLGFTPVEIAAIKGHVNVIVELKKHINLSQPEDTYTSTPHVAMIAARKGRTNILAKLIELEYVWPMDARTLAYVAAYSGHPNIITQLAELLKVDFSNDDSLARAAAEAGHANVIATLAKLGFDFEKPIQTKPIPSIFANNPTMQKLAEFDRLTPAGIAARKGHVNVLHELKKHNALVHNITDEDYKVLAIRLAPDLFNEANLANVDQFQIEELIEPACIQVLRSKSITLDEILSVFNIRGFIYSISRPECISALHDNLLTFTEFLNLCNKLGHVNDCLITPLRNGLFSLIDIAEMDYHAIYNLLYPESLPVLTCLKQIRSNILTSNNIEQSHFVSRIYTKISQTKNKEKLDEIQQQLQVIIDNPDIKSPELVVIEEKIDAILAKPDPHETPKQIIPVESPSKSAAEDHAAPPQESDSAPSKDKSSVETIIKTDKSTNKTNLLHSIVADIPQDERYNTQLEKVFTEQTHTLFSKVESMTQAFKANEKYEKMIKDLHAKIDANANTDDQKKLQMIQNIQKSVLHLRNVIEILTDMFEKHTSENKITLKRKNNKILIDSPADKKEIEALTSVIARSVDMLKDAEKILDGNEVTPKEAIAFNANLKALAKESNDLAGSGHPLLYQVGVGLLLTAAFIAVATAILVIAGTAPNGVALLPPLASYCGFGLTRAITAGTSLSTGAAATLAGATVLGVPTGILTVSGTSAFFGGRKSGLSAAVEKLAKDVNELNIPTEPKSKK